MAIQIIDPIAGIPDLVQGETWHAATPEPARADVHPFVEMSIMLQGCMEHRIEEFACLVMPGDTVLISAWEPHSWRYMAPDTTHVTIHFAPDFLHDESVAGVSWLSLFAKPPAERPRIQTAIARREILAIGERLRREVAERPPGWQDAVRISVLDVLLRLVRDQGTLSPASLEPRYNHTRLARIVPAVTLVHANLSRRIGVTDGAAACRLSVRQFAAVFHQTMGMGFATFGLRARLREAGQLLHQTDLPVEAVATRTGFSDKSHLHRVFARAFRCTPSEFRATIASPVPVGSHKDRTETGLPGASAQHKEYAPHRGSDHGGYLGCPGGETSTFETTMKESAPSRGMAKG